MDTTILISVMGLALVVTKMVDGIRNAFDMWGTPRYKFVWNLLAFGFGIMVAYLFTSAGFDIAGAGPSTLGTGLIIGAGASGWHEVLDRVAPTRIP